MVCQCRCRLRLLLWWERMRGRLCRLMRLLLLLLLGCQTSGTTTTTIIDTVGDHITTALPDTGRRGGGRLLYAGQPDIVERDRSVLFRRAILVCKVRC